MADKVISVRLPEDTAAVLERKARDMDMSLSEYLRGVLDSDEPSTLTQLRIEIRELKETLEYIIFGMEIMQQTNIEYAGALLRRIEAGSSEGMTESEYYQKLRTADREIRGVMAKAKEAVSSRIAAYHRDYDPEKDPLRIQLTQRMIEEDEDRALEEEDEYDA